MQVIFNRDWRGQKKGDIVDFSEKVARKFAHTGFVSLYDDTKSSDFDAASQDLTSGDPEKPEAPENETKDHKADKKKKGSSKQ